MQYPMTRYSETKKLNLKLKSFQFVEEFLEYLKQWENSGVRRDFRLSSQTAFGMRVSLTAALELADYLGSPEIGFKYLMTRRLNQDALEVYVKTVINILENHKYLRLILYFCPFSALLW